MSVSSAIKITKDSTAGSSNWYRTPGMGDQLFTTFTGTLTSGDSIVIEVSNDDALWASLTADRSQSTGTATQKASSISQTATSFSGVFVGTWKWVRITKTGTAGTATVYVR